MKHLPYPATAAALLAVAGFLVGAGSAWGRAEGVPLTRPAPRATSRPALARPPTGPVRSRVTAHYVRSAAWAVLYRRGCRAGRRKESGVVVLAFGKQLYNGHSYGTLTFRGRFASNRTITRGLRAYTWGYARCVPHGSAASIWLARGTSNYWPSVPSSLRSGRRWARETARLAEYLRVHGLDRRVRAAAALDAEPRWE